MAATAHTSPTAGKTPRCRRTGSRNRWRWRSAARCWLRRRSVERGDSDAVDEERLRRARPQRLRTLAHRRPAPPGAPHAHRLARRHHGLAHRRPAAAGRKSLTRQRHVVAGPPPKGPTDRTEKPTDATPPQRNPRRRRRSRARRPAKRHLPAPAASNNSRIRHGRCPAAADDQGLWTTSPTWIVSEEPTIRPKLRFG